MNRLREKTTATLLIAIFMTSAMILVVPAIAKKGGTTIQDGTLLDSAGNPLVLGFDVYGYNYQGHMFNGWYWNNQRPSTPWTKDTIDQAPSKTWLIMKWSDTWLSNMDRDGDGKLDRGYPYPTGTSDPPIYTSSAAPGAWVTNHQFGEYEVDGKVYKWNYFVKIAHPGSDAVKIGDTWYTADGTEIGLVIWGAYAIIQQVENDPGAGIHGLQYISPNCAGLGAYK